MPMPRASQRVAMNCLARDRACRSSGSSGANMCQLWPASSPAVAAVRQHARRVGARSARSSARASARRARVERRRAARAARGRCAALTSGRLNLPPATSTSRVPSGRRDDAVEAQHARSRAPRARRCTTSAPPSIVVMFLFGWKLNDDRCRRSCRCGLPRHARADRERGVLDHAQAVARARARRARPCRTGRPAKCVGHDRAACAGVIARLGRGEVDVARGEVDVDEHRRRADAHDHVRRREERHAPA